MKNIAHHSTHFNRILRQLGLVGLLAAALGLAGCAAPTHRQVNIGAGTVIGGVVGHALIGGPVATIGGAAAGALIGNSLSSSGQRHGR